MFDEIFAVVNAPHLEVISPGPLWFALDLVPAVKDLGNLDDLTR